MYCEGEFRIQYNQKIFCYAGLLYVFVESSYAVYVAAIISNLSSRGFVSIILHFWKEGSKITMSRFGFIINSSIYTASTITGICIIINVDL